jgi:hypothetical protein
MMENLILTVIYYFLFKYLMKGTGDYVVWGEQLGNEPDHSAP